MKISLNGDYELWDITYSHLCHLLPYKRKNYHKTIRHMKSYGNFRSRYIRKHVYITQKRLKLEIKFLERELKYRNNYNEYRTFCELFVVGVNEKNPDRPGSYTGRCVRQDESFILAFAGWCEDHGMMVQSRKLMRYLDRIKQGGIVVKFTKEDILKDKVVKQ